LLHLGPRRRRLPRCPHFPCARSQYFGIPKGEYDRAKRVVQLTTRKLYEQCSDPASDSIPGICILRYRMHFTDAYSPTYGPRAVFNGSAGPSPSSSPPSLPPLHINDHIIKVICIFRGEYNMNQGVAEQLIVYTVRKPRLDYVTTPGATRPCTCVARISHPITRYL